MTADSVPAGWYPQITQTAQILRPESWNPRTPTFGARLVIHVLPCHSEVLRGISPGVARTLAPLNSRTRCLWRLTGHWCLRLGHCLLNGHWCLGFGPCKLSPATCKLAAQAALRLAKRPSLHVRKHLWKHPQSCIRLHRRVRRPLYLDLDLDVGPDLNLDLNLNLGHPLFETLSRQSFAPLFLLSSPALTLGFWLLTSDFFLRLLLPPRQSVGRPLPGRIVVRDLRTTTYR